MSEWWDVNGKSFNWSSLPNEIKERIIQYCVRGTSYFGDYFHRLSPIEVYLWDHSLRLCDLAQKSDDWKSLLIVSSLVRSITFRVLFSASEFFPGGYCITSSRYVNFQRRMGRLSRSYQLTETPGKGLPTNDKTRALAKQYLLYPKFCPQLAHFATFQHAIQKLCLGFDVVDFFHFFKITELDLLDMRSYRRSCVNCEMIERLPHLNEVAIILPSQTREMRTPAMMNGMTTSEFHHVVARLIYERAATVLASVKRVTIKKFPDDHGERRFNQLRAAAQNGLIELYADCGGGIKIADGGQLVEVDQGTRRPHCQCAVPCIHDLYL